MKARDPFFDVVKAAAILFVVIGHCKTECAMPFSFRLDNFIVAFNMAKVGTCTLGIYLLHQWVLARLVQCYPSAFATRVGTIGVAFGLFLFTFAITYVTQEKIAWMRKWVWGKAYGKVEGLKG